MRPYNNNSKGFTLIEVIVTLVLVGIMAVVAGLGIVQGTRAFIFTKEATILGQKGDLAMNRLRRSVQNMTSIVGTPDATTLAINRLDKGGYVTETYTFSAPALQLNFNGLGAQTLANAVQAFALTYSATDGTSWTPDKGIGSLATVNVSTTLTGPGGASITYVDRIVPRNTYTPKINYSVASAGASGGYNCFVATVAYGNGDYPSVKVLRQFRDRVLAKYSIGQAFIKWYYRVGPNLADSFKSSDFWRYMVRIALMPIVGMSFLILYYPAGILLLLLMTWLLARLVIKSARMQNFFLQRPHWRGVRSQKGSLLIGLIVTMVIMASLGGAMLSMFSAANAASVPAHFSQRAYYLAESGKNYAAKMFIVNKDSDQTFVNALYTTAGVIKTFPVGADNFKVAIKTFYLNGAAGTTNSLSASKWGNFSDNWLNSNLPAKQGALQVPTGTTSTAISNFTSVTRTADTLNFVLGSAVTRLAGRVMPVVYATAGTYTTITATNIGDSTGGHDINIGNINTGGGWMLPRVNGTISFKDNATPANTWYIIYDTLVEDSTTHNAILRGIRNFPGKLPIPTAGILISNLADSGALVLGRYAQMTSTGTVGTGSMAVSQTIIQNQPLDVITLYSAYSGGGDTQEFNALIGSATQQANIDGGKAWQITQTAQTYSYVGTTPTYMQESLQGAKWAVPHPLAELWAQADYKLSYDLQAKIKFTETEDDTSASPVNHPGNYMPGIAFRVKCTPGTTNKDCTYYGVSFVRGIQGRAAHSSSGGCNPGPSYYTEEDDISDSLFAQYGSNANARPNAGDILCTGADKFVPTSWSSNTTTQSSTAGDAVVFTDRAALDGIPYIMIWQKDWSRTAGACGGTSSPWDWLTFMPLVEGRVQQAYRYLSAGGRPEGWYQGQIAGDPRNGTANRQGPYTFWKLKDKYGILKTTTVEGVIVLGTPGAVIIRDPSTATATSAGTPLNKYQGVVTPICWVIPNDKDTTYASYNPAEYQALKAVYNYRIYPKPWVTLSAKIVEMVGNFDCNNATGTAGNERVNAIMAFVSDPDGVAGTYGASTKDEIRNAYPRKTGTGDYTVRWPDTGDYFTTAVWDRGGYSSKMVPTPANNCGWVNVDVKIVEKGKDSDGDNVVAHTSFLTTGAANYFTATANDIPEFGLHTAGVSRAIGCTGTGCETAYFADFYWRAYKGGISGLVPGIQEQ